MPQPWTPVPSVGLAWDNISKCTPAHADAKSAMERVKGQACKQIIHRT